MRLLLFVFLVLFPYPAWAQDVPEDVATVPPGDDKIIVLREGDKAPFTGQLFDPSTALRWANWLQQYKIRLKQDVEVQKKLGAAETAYQGKLLMIEQERSKELLKLYQEREATLNQRIAALEKSAANPPWYQSPWLGFAAGAISVVALYSFLNRLPPGS